MLLDALIIENNIATAKFSIYHGEESVPVRSVDRSFFKVGVGFKIYFYGLNNLGRLKKLKKFSLNGVF